MLASPAAWTEDYYGCGLAAGLFSPCLAALVMAYVCPTYELLRGCGDLRYFLYQVKQIAKERTPFPISRLGELLLLQSSKAASQVLYLTLTL